MKDVVRHSERLILIHFPYHMALACGVSITSYKNAISLDYFPTPTYKDLLQNPRHLPATMTDLNQAAAAGTEATASVPAAGSATAPATLSGLFLNPTAHLTPAHVLTRQCCCPPTFDSSAVCYEWPWQARSLSILSPLTFVDNRCF